MENAVLSPELYHTILIYEVLCQLPFLVWHQ